MRRLLPLVLWVLWAPVGFAAPPPAQPESGSGFRQVEAVTASNQMVATANPHASLAALEILGMGGSSVDAAIAAALVLNLVEPQSSGIGGGGFMLTYEAKSRRVRSYDGRETAPAEVDPNQFLDEASGAPVGFMSAVVGGQSVGAPGLLRLFDMAHKRHGRLPWKALFQPAIRLARAGFPISPRLHTLLGLTAFQMLAMEPTASYFYERAAPKPVGTILKNVAFAEALELIAVGGARAFYEGPIATDMVSAVQTSSRRPGRLSLADLSRYRALERKPLCRPYRSNTVCSMGAPSSGGTAVLQILAMMEPTDVSGAPGPDTAHRFLEATRLAFADRDAFVADPAFFKPAKLLEPGYLRGRAALIGDKAAATVSAGSPKGAPRARPLKTHERPSTTHLCVVDAQGNAVSLTASIENAFGSMLMVRGFLLNNQITDFAFAPEVKGVAVANRIQPGKRPRSSMAPVVVTDDKGLFRLAIGSAGGGRIIPFVAWSLLAVLDTGLNVQAALSAPHVVTVGATVELEAPPGTASATETLRTALVARGHKVAVGELNSGMQAIERTPAGLVGAVDPRREGLAVGTLPDKSK